MKTRRSAPARWLSRSCLTSVTVLALVLPLAGATPAQAVDPAADLTMSITASRSTVLSTALLTFTATATNAGPDAATKSRIGQVLPRGTAFQSAAVTQGTCAAPNANRVVLCRVGRLGPNRTATMTLVVRVLKPRGGLVGMAAARSEVPDPIRKNSIDSVTVEVRPRVSDLELTMDSPVLTNDAVRYSMTVLNKGPHPSRRTRVIDHLPRGVTYNAVVAEASSSSAKCALAQPRQLVCQLGQLGVNKSATVTFTAVVNVARGLLTNKAAAMSWSLDRNKANNSAVRRALIPGTDGVKQADTHVMLTPDRTTVEKGKQLTYIIAASNAGPGKATGAVVEDTLGEGVAFVRVEPPAGSSCTTPAVGATGHVRCDIGNLDVQETNVVKVVVDVTAADDSTLTNTATLSTDLLTEDPVTTDSIVVRATPVVIEPSTVIVNATFTLIGETVVEMEIPEAPTPVDRASVHNTPENGPTHDTVINTISIKNMAYGDDWAPPSLDVEFAKGITINKVTLLRPDARCDQTLEHERQVLHCSTGPIPRDHQQVGSSEVQVIKVETTVDEAVVIANPINHMPACNRALVSQNFYDLENTGWLIGPNCEHQYGMSASSMASIPWSGDDGNDNNNRAPVSVSPHLPELAFSGSTACETEETSMMFMLLQQECDSPVNIVHSLGATLASMAAAAVGIAVLDQIVFYTIIAVYIAAECAVLR